MPSTTLQRMDSPGRKDVGGCLVTYPSGAAKAVSWVSGVPVDATETAKACAARLLAECLDAGRVEDAERTNWASVTAGLQRIVFEFNAGVGGGGGEAPV